jgi:hypothetical protein
MKNRSLGEKSKENRGRIRTTREREREKERGGGEKETAARERSPLGVRWSPERGRRT